MSKRANENEGGSTPKPKPLVSPGPETLRTGMKYGRGAAKERGEEVVFEADAPSPKEKRHAWWIFGALVVIAVLGLASLFVANALQGDGGNKEQEDDIARRNLDEMSLTVSNPGSAADWKGPLPIEAAEGFTGAATIEERLKWVRDAKRVEPILRNFFSEGAGATEVVADCNPIGSVHTATVAFVRFHVGIKDGGNRLLCVVLTDEGGKVDFECYVRHGSVPWSELLSGRTEAADEVRVVVERGTYYNHRFSDEEAWAHFTATSPDLEKPLSFYAARGSEIEEALTEVSASRPMRVTLAIRSLDGSHARGQFEVSAVQTVGWVR